MNQRRLFVILAVVAGALLLGGAAWAWQAGGTQRAVAAALPAPPDLTAAPAAVRDRILAADARARGRFTAGAGLRELSRLYHANGYPDEALRCYFGLRQLEPTEARWYHLAALLTAGYGELEPAVELWRRATTLDPTYAPAWLRLGETTFKANQPAEAEAAFNAALRQAPDDAYALFGLARLDFEAGRWEPARQKLETVVSRTNYTLGYDLIVSLYERLGQADRAKAIRASAKASGAYRDPADPWVDALIEDCFEPYRLGIAAGNLARSGDPAGAVRLLRRAVEVTPDDVSAIFQLGTLLIQQRDIPGAIEQLRRCTELSPDFSDGWANLSALQASIGETAAAARTLAEGLRQCPDSPGLHLQLARNLQQAGRIAEAIPEFQTSIRLRPNEPEAYLELGNLLIRQGRNAEGLAVVEQALVAEPGNPMALSILAFSAIHSGDEAEARRRLATVREQPRVPAAQTAQLNNAFREKFGRAP
ncbi:cellulose synthase subunit BcsC [Lacunisphaera limnophila]|uniref:Cellulose synthase subunit BcsC n=1 Tax=Lacunisphaera limnophila TaxID=1838286 RepID=A0A1D8ARU4_9BACT|nr:tetratricopeptide repeat protein [Lacunisphaera limnophila]AOS43590.1 cellulose synthase subunit BcsC [Lacunisphaera limnophila]